MKTEIGIVFAILVAGIAGILFLVSLLGPGIPAALVGFGGSWLLGFVLCLVSLLLGSKTHT